MKTHKRSEFFKRAVQLIVLMLVVVFIGNVAGVDSAHAKSADKTEKKIAAAAESFKRDFPNVKFTKINVSAINGLFEVIMETNIVYYSPATGIVIAGEMHEKTGKNITAEKRQALMAQQEAELAKLLDTLPLDKAIKIGSGKNIVIEFTDLDCPYCRKVEEFFKTRNDITRYVFLFPLEQLHPQSAAQSREVLCSKDQAAAFNSAMSGGLDKAELKGCGDKEKDIALLLAEHKTLGERMKVSGTPVMWVNKQFVNGADTEKIEKNLLSGATGSVVMPQS